MKRIIILLFLASATYPSLSQSMFGEKFDDCEGKPCLYCGDTSAHYLKDLGAYLAWQINHSIVNSTYDFKNFEAFYEVFVDSEGNTCVISDSTLGYGWSWRIKDDVRRWLNGMSDWQPAVKHGVRINSTVLVECKFRNNFLFAGYAMKPEDAKKDSGK